MRYIILERAPQMRSFPICRNHQQKTIRTGEKIPLYGKGGVNEDMAIVSFVCFMCCSLQRQKFAAVMREKQS
jgi:hypothetical protein